MVASNLKIAPGDNLREAIDEGKRLCTESSALGTKLAELQNDGDARQSCVPHDTVIQLSTFLTQSTGDREKYRLHSLLKGSRLTLDSPPPRKKSPELLKILDDVKAELGKKEYESMVQGLTKKGRVVLEPEDSAALKEVSKVATTLINMGFSVFGVVVAVFYFGDSITTDVSMKTLIAVASALIVVIAEAFVLTRYVLIPES
ncbi:endoplasmic reticulum-based factor for assembly of V-ATPase-domain-containing protein [Cladochytrium replicatum]|nr:endoplasmic reticulum-based factor for assembly of V-ATPase-domain-containing protein [Cladochytrium replicatum]